MERRLETETRISDGVPLGFGWGWRISDAVPTPFENARRLALLAPPFCALPESHRVGSRLRFHFPSNFGRPSPGVFGTIRNFGHRSPWGGEFRTPIPLGAKRPLEAKNPISDALPPPFGERQGYRLALLAPPFCTLRESQMWVADYASIFPVISDALPWGGEFRTPIPLVQEASRSRKTEFRTPIPL